MNVIYETKGRAREFSELACNLYTGCGHRCIYCYGAAVTHQDELSFKYWPAPRKGILEALRRDAKALRSRGETRSTLFCFVTDPYQELEVELKITRRAIEIMHEEQLGVVILTKGGRRAMRDFDLLVPGKDQFATTLTLLDGAESLKWEPGAAQPHERTLSLREAHGRGIETWVSLEPVIDPDVVLNIIEATHEYVDSYRVGKMNYHHLAQEIDWIGFAHEVINLMDTLGVRYYIKTDLAKYLGKDEGFWNDQKV